ncbi:hypothetical protein Vadar_018699 [Vaccinium darrowii]|uniref:Uncharacterized protein n=1 Tax=Vaccinium darrowii TaxID=229202 RepID=A0ACB7Y0B6_9ERIC|nr:hypothetical protein Vadar_018699 [Vaccinium darrowii]
MPRFQKFCTNPSSVDVLRDSGARPHVKGLGSLLIQDITIKNGNNMNPASFTKKWRMCNNGTVSWPANTNLASIGGDKLNDTLAVEIRVCITSSLSN